MRALGQSLLHKPVVPSFSARVIQWFSRYGRRDLPWQVADPYAVWVSEIMLQQTQVAKVLDYYARFMARFPTLAALAQAREDEVLALWSGLGYYNRARHLHRAAGLCLSRHGGQLPHTLEALLALPGIGRSTAGAILSLTGQSAQPILDGNVKRLFARHFLIEGDTNRSAVQKRLWALAEKHLPETGFAHYNQALMDLGANVCRRSGPRCDECPVSDTCQALQHKRVAELPQRRQKTGSPRVSMPLAVLIHDHQSIPAVFLCQRSSHGIWPGLWFVPVFESASQLDDWWKATGLPQGHAGEPITHVLTHRQLVLKPRVLRCATRPALNDQADAIRGRWVNVAELTQYAHPRALQKLLQQVGLRSDPNQARLGRS